MASSASPKFCSQLGYADHPMLKPSVILTGSAEECNSYELEHRKSIEDNEQNNMKNSEENIAGYIANGNENASAMFQENNRSHQYDSLPMTASPPVMSMVNELQKSMEDNAQNGMQNSEEAIAGYTTNGKDNASAMFQENKEGSHRYDSLLMTASPPVMSMVNHLKEGLFTTTCQRNDPAIMPLITVPNANQRFADAHISLNGTAKMGIAGPPIGVLDIGVSKVAYFFRVALPGVRKDYCEFSCEVESNGKVHLQGSTSGGGTIKKRSRVFHMTLQQLCPAGAFTLSFSLPGPVDPRLFSPNFRSDGIFEAVVIKHGVELKEVEKEIDEEGAGSPC